MVSPLRQNGEIKAISDLHQCLDTAYEDPDRKGTAERELRALKQGNGDLTSHYAKFRALVTVLGWQGEAERSALYHSLSYELKEALAKTLPPPDESFTEYVAKIKLLDDQMRRFAAECKPPGGRPASERQDPAKKPGPPLHQSGRLYRRHPASRLGAYGPGGKAKGRTTAGPIRTMGR